MSGFRGLGLQGVLGSTLPGLGFRVQGIQGFRALIRGF